MSKLDLRVRFNNKLHSIILNDYRIGGCKWNDIEHGECIEYPVNKEDIVIALGIDKTISDLQSQLDQANEMIKLMYRDLLETGEWQKSMAVYRKEAERKLQELRGGDFSGE